MAKRGGKREGAGRPKLPKYAPAEGWIIVHDLQGASSVADVLGGLKEFCLRRERARELQDVYGGRIVKARLTQSDGREQVKT